MNPNLAKMSNSEYIFNNISETELQIKTEKNQPDVSHIKSGLGVLSCSKLYFYCLYRLLSFVLLHLWLVYSRYISKDTESHQRMFSSYVTVISETET